MSSSATQAKKPVCTVGFLFTAFQTLGLIVLFYFFSITLTFYNKKFITVYPFPLSITILHLFVKFLIAWGIRVFLERWKRQRRVELGWRDYVTKVAPAGITSSLDIGLSNWSFEFITVSLYTMTKSSSIIFIMFFAILLKLEKKRWSSIVVVLCIALGLFMFTYKSTQFVLEGFLLVLGASFVSGLRWTTAQLVTQRSDIGLSNPIDMMYHVQPWMMIALLPLSASFEGLEIATTDQLFRAGSLEVLSTNLSILVLGALLAFGLEFSEYLLLSRTSSLTLNISGIFKEVCTLLLAAKINGDEMNHVNAIGLLMCLVGISLHVCIKAMHRAHGVHRSFSISWSAGSGQLRDQFSWRSTPGLWERTLPIPKAELGMMSGRSCVCC